METEIAKLKKELQWYYLYMFYVSNFHNVIDAEACGYADGDNEYIENLNPLEKWVKELPRLEEYQKKQLAIILISETLTHKTNIETIETMLNKLKQL